MMLKMFETFHAISIERLYGVIRIRDRYDQNLMRIMCKDTIPPSVYRVSKGPPDTYNSIFKHILDLKFFPCHENPRATIRQVLDLVYSFHGIN